MNLEEKLWDYIDGNCTAAERANIASRLAVDVELAALYQELLLMNSELEQLDLEEPSMSFTRNVMEKVKVELKPVALKTKVDQRIIYSISAFFIFTLLSIIGYVISNSSFNVDFAMPKMDLSLDMTKWFNSATMKIFILVDVALILLYADGYLRKNRAQKKGA